MSARDPLLRAVRPASAPARRRLALAAGLAVLLLLAATGAAEAWRPGGGHTFSGHSSGSSGGGFHSSSPSFGSRSSGTHFVPISTGGGGSGCGLFGCFLLLVLIVVVVLVLYWIKQQKGGGPPSSPFGGGGPADAPPGPELPPGRDLDSIRDLDPEFSVVLFEDFAYALYAKAHEARGDRGQLDSLAPYLSAQARAELASRPPVGAPVSGVVIGAMHAIGLAMPAADAQGAAPAGDGQAGAARPQVQVVLEFESNMTVGAGTGDATQYVRERWWLVRDAGVRTRPPEAAQSFHCPNCGAPFGPNSASAGDRCEYCGEVVSGGRFDWSVSATQALEIESRPPQLTGTVEEVGNDWPTVVHPALAERWAELQSADPASGDQAMLARLQLIYTELNPAWTALDLAPVRGFVSDGLFDYLQYWIAAYRHQGLRNQLDNMRLTRWQLAKVVRDKHFDAVTFRIWASGRDYTVVSATGEVVGGNPHADRDYSEYWTLIRGAGTRGAPRADKSCPNCGAPLEVNMAGRCNHCDAKITSGDFDGVLSKIEQDESYSG
jgi:DNA-directed RNA polymerase subunit RPC12/RpoP